MKFFNPMALLLKYQGYPPAVIVAVILHVGLIWFMLDKAMAPSDFLTVETTTYINATVIQENPQRLRRLEQLELQRAQQARDAREAEQQRQQDLARQREQEQAQQQAREEAARREAAAEQQRQQEIARQQAQSEAERRAREEAVRREQERQQQQAREQAAQQAAQEAARQAAVQRAAEQSAMEQQNIAAYTAIIHDTVAQNWSIPPSARNGMVVMLRIQLVPTGEVISANVVQSSGDPAFDRSAEQAVRRAGRFPELRDMPISLFEREFRTFNLRFRPEDLLR